MKSIRNFHILAFLIVILCSGCASSSPVHVSSYSQASSSNLQTPFDVATISPTMSIKPANTISASPSPTGVATSSPSMSTKPSGEIVSATSSPIIIKFSPFNEDNFKKYFPFNMSLKDAEKELKSYKIAIKDVFEDTDDAEQPTGWTVTTDHFQLCFDKKKRLCEVFAQWETAKGLKEGDSVDKLHQLYGKEDKVYIDDYGTYFYIYNRNGFRFVNEFDTTGESALGWWIVYLNNVASPF